MAEFPKKIWLIGTGTFGYDAVWCDDPKPDPGIDDEDVVGPYVLGADDELDRLRQRVAELEVERKTQEFTIIELKSAIDLRGQRVAELEGENKRLRQMYAEVAREWVDNEQT